MSPRVFHLVAGELPPGSGGVGDYTTLVAEGLARAGHEVHLWCPDGGRALVAGATTHELPDRFGPESRRTLDDALRTTPGRLLLQYVPNTLGARGANVPFCSWLQRRGRSADVRVMFHEPYFYFGWHPGRNGLAVAQRLMAYRLLRTAPVAYISTDTWRRYLSPYAPDGIAFVTLPIPATVPAAADRPDVDRWRARLTAEGTGPLVAHFGTFGDHVATELRGVVPRLLAADPNVRVACVGRGGESFAAEFASSGRVVATGELAPADVAAVLRAADLALQPYPDGVTTRRTTVMAALANGVPVLSTTGELTEDVWRDSDALALVPAGDHAALASRAVDLLRDAAALSRLGTAGARAYRDHFALELTVRRLASEPAVTAA